MRRVGEDDALAVREEALELAIDGIAELEAALAAEEKDGRLDALNGAQRNHSGKKASLDIVRARHSGAFSRSALRTSGGSVAKVIFSSVPE